MFAACFGRSAVALALLAMACRTRDAPRPLDARLADAMASDAIEPARDAAVPLDAAAPTVTKLVASGDSTCAVLSDLTLRCWGGNAHGQLGSGLTSDAARPVVPSVRAVKDLQLAGATACALLDDASVACWGELAWHGHAEDTLRPTGVLGVIGVKQIFVVPGRACARVANDSLVCWGRVDARGHFAAGAAHRVPTPVVGLDHVAGLTEAGAFADDGRLWAWGHDGAPRRLAVAGVEQIADRDDVVCGRLRDGHVMCAASERCGPVAKPEQAPNKRVASKATAKPATTAKSATGKTVTGKAVTDRSRPAATKRTAANAPTTATPTEPTGEPAAPLAFTSARQLAFGLGTCVVTTAGKLQCSDGCRRLDPARLDRVDRVVGRCAVLRSGAVTCFDHARPTAVPGVRHASLLAAGRAHACAVVDGSITCWGDDSHGQLGGFAAAQ